MQQFKSAIFLAAWLGICPQLFAKENDALDIQNLLLRMQQAAQQLNYSGIFVYQQANQIRTSRIAHGFDGHTELEKLELLDGKQKEYIRRNDVVTCYLPDTKTIQVEKNVVQEAFPAVINGAPASLLSGYQIKKGDTSRVAGTDCQTLSFEPKDKYRFGYRLCVDVNSGLLLRAQTVNLKREVIEQIAFTQLSFNDFDKAIFQSSFSNTSKWPVENMTVQTKVNSGWVVQFLPAGFKKMREIKRIIPISERVQENDLPNASTSDSNLVDDKKGANAHQSQNQSQHQSQQQIRQQQVIQMIFSDGLSAFSVFIEPANASRVEGSLQQGAVTIMGKRQGDYWLTVVGEVPFSAITEVINSIEYKPK
jgi:sigma-E factor negative regulatory protein RseB